MKQFRYVINTSSVLLTSPSIGGGGIRTALTTNKADGLISNNVKGGEIHET